MAGSAKRLVALSTCDSAEAAARIARHLVEQRVAACVNIVPGATSVYRWQGRIEEAAEWILIIKTRSDRFAALREELVKVHPYETPELVALEVTDGLPAYLAWIDQESGLNSPS